jgi:hypothetical protein
MSFRTYLFVGVIIGLLIYLSSLILGEEVVNWAADTEFNARARGLSGLATLILDPIVFVMNDNPPVGAVLCAVLWPVAVAWLFLAMLLLIIIVGSDVARDINRQLHVPPIWI